MIGKPNELTDLGVWYPKGLKRISKKRPGPPMAAGREP